MGGFGGYSHAVPMVPMWSQSPALIHQADAPAASVGQGGAWTIERRYRAANGGIVEAGRDDFGRARWRYLVLPPTPGVATAARPVATPAPTPTPTPTSTPKVIGAGTPEAAAKPVARPVSPVTTPRPTSRPDGPQLAIAPVPTGAPPTRNEGIVIEKVFNLTPAERAYGRYFASGPHAAAFQSQVKAMGSATETETFRDDSSKPRVSVFGTDKDKRDAAKTRVQTVLGDTALVAAYDPENPLVKDLKFWRDKPEIVFQAPPDPDNHDRGEVVKRLSFDATDQEIIGARRLADPTYDPSKDDAESGSPPWIGITAGAALLALLVITKPADPQGAAS